MYWHIDRREWDALADVRDSEVEVAFPDLGAAGARRPREAVVESYRRTLAGFEATQHLLGSFLVTPDANSGVVACSAQVQAVHRRSNATGGPLWVLGCEHHYALRQADAGQWRITGLRMSLSWGAGNQHVTALGPVT
jgi:hypothetical protein